MTTVVEVSQQQMYELTGSPLPMGYADPKNDRVLIRKGLSSTERKAVLAHEFEHMAKGEEGPILGSIIGAAGSLIGGLLGADAAGDAADAQVQGNQAAINENARQFDTLVGLQQPAIDARNTSLNSLLALLGLTEGGPSQTELLRSTPGFQFATDEAQRALETSAAARGGLLSGGTLEELQRQRLGFADQTFNARVGQLSSLAGLGTAGANQVASAIPAFAGNNAALLQNQGSANASGILGQANAFGQGVSNAAFLLGQGIQGGGGGGLFGSPATPPIFPTGG